MTRLEKWYAILAHAKAIADYAEAQTIHGDRPESPEDRVVYRANRIVALGESLDGGGE